MERKIVVNMSLNEALDIIQEYVIREENKIDPSAKFHSWANSLQCDYDAEDGIKLIFKVEE